MSNILRDLSMTLCLTMKKGLLLFEGSCHNVRAGRTAPFDT